MAKLKIQGKEIEVDFTEETAEKIAVECKLFTEKLEKLKTTEQITDDNLEKYANKRFKIYADFLYNTIGSDNIIAIVGDNNALTLNEIDAVTASVCDALTAIIPKKKNQPKFSFK